MSASACTHSMPGYYYYSFFCLHTHHQLDWFRWSGFRRITSDSLFMASDTILCFFCSRSFLEFPISLDWTENGTTYYNNKCSSASSTLKAKVKVPYSDINVGEAFFSLSEAIEPVVCDACPVRRQTYGYLPSQKAMPLPLDRYSLPTPLRVEGSVGLSHLYGHPGQLQNIQTTA